ncbi:MAG: N-acetylmuramoyl-L-alanine amidase, partial [Bacilli bacterium]|nr:N-acetylmuramoyl-L-alanine amidase [Bacilli bacterium]
AKWSEEEVKEVYVGEGLDYATLDEAVQNAPEGATIILAAGEYSLSVVINKSLTIVGPYKDAEASRERENEAVIKVAKDVAGNLAAKKIVFNGVHLQGTGGGPGIPGVFFQDGGGIEEIAFLSCKISDMNTFFKANGTSSSLNLRIENSYIHTIGQFVVWTASSKVQSVLLLGNIVDGSTCGSVTNAAAALFRVRSGVLEAYNNTFIGDSKNAPGYFEAIAAPSFVKYNTFENVTLFAHPTAANQLTFDKNLYLDKNGKALAAAPSEVAMNGVTVDATVCASAKEVAEAYMGYLVNAQPDRYFRLSFDLAGGELAGSAPLGYDSQKGLLLPVPQKADSIFVGWYLNGEKVEAIEAGTTGNLELVAKWREDALYVGVGEDYYYPTLAEALAAAKAGDTIIIVAGEYAENVTISVADLTIKGPNAGVEATSEQRVAEAVIKGVLTVSPEAKNLTIDGLAFTGAAQVKASSNNATYEGLTFENNKVYDTNASSTAWDGWTRYVLDAFVQFTLSSGGQAVQFTFANNEFVNVDAVVLLVNRAVHLSVDNNVFEDFGQDAIRVEGGYAGGMVAVTNNRFEQTTANHGYNALYMLSSSLQNEVTTILVENNVFKQIGQDATESLHGVISAGRFQEQKAVNWYIQNNVFDHCYDLFWLRNNGATSANWSCSIENNQFLGVPTNFYYGSYRNTDTSTTNPHLAVFGSNYYEDNDGNVITDLSAYADMFKHLASYGTASATKPAETETTPLEFYSISYELEGGETRESFTYAYTSYNEAPIALPSLTKTNYQFNGWLLNGELVMEIPADAKGDLVLVAKFTVLEGEVYTIEYVTNKEKALWPSRAAIDREEIIEELFKDLYEWAQSNGETRGYDEYVAATKTLIAGYSDINLRNTKLGNYPAEDGSTEYFFNVPKYYEKWNEFFALFNEAMLAVNATQVFYTDTYATMVRLHQFITWSSTGQSYFNAYLGKMRNAAKIPAEIPTTYRGGQIVQLPELHMANGLAFLGWYDNPEFTGSPITAITDVEAGNKKFYAKWEDEILVETVEINQIDRLLLFESHQLVWNLLPLNATDKEVEFFSSNESVATVSPKGLITGYATGTTTITMKVYGNRALDVQFELTVYCPDYIEGYFEGESYGIVGGELQLKANVLYNDGTKEAATWTSLTPEIATVDANGKVTLLAPGMARIVAGASKNAELKLEYVITVLEAEAADILGFILESHESNVFQRYNLNIGSTYNKDIFGSVSKLLMNYDYSVDASRRDTEKQNNTGDYYDTMESVEFITVHYTGNMAAGADAKANANYFVGANSVSIHYTTGNDGIYQCLDHTTGGFHAGDSGAMAQVGKFQWMPTGVRVGANDAQYPTFTISQDFYFEINGQKTSVKMPTPWNYDGRGTNHTLNADGTISSASGYKSTAFTGRTPESFINDQDLPFKVVDGEYYMGTTWWCYTQVYEGRICSTGGNRNSVGIESCVNEGSDLWYTWQITAQLVARLMQELNLDITRVRGHHFFSGKNCPQPMLENDLEIWYEFLGLVEAEYELLTEYNDYEISFESHNPEIIDNHGRVIKQPSQTTCVTYTVNITRGGETQSITLATMVQGLYVGR